MDVDVGSQVISHITIYSHKVHTGYDSDWFQEVIQNVFNWSKIVLSKTFNIMTALGGHNTANVPNGKWIIFGVPVLMHIMVFCKKKQLIR